MDWKKIIQNSLINEQIFKAWIERKRAGFRRKCGWRRQRWSKTVETSQDAIEVDFLIFLIIFGVIYHMRLVEQPWTTLFRMLSGWYISPPKFLILIIILDVHWYFIEYSWCIIFISWFENFFNRILLWVLLNYWCNLGFFLVISEF